MPCMHVQMQQGYCFCMNNFHRINTSKGTVTFIRPVGLLSFRADDISTPVKSSLSRYISGTLSGQDEVCSISESNTL